MSEQTDRQFLDTFAIVLGALVLFTILVYFLANAIHDRTQGAYVTDNPLKADLVAERLSPVARVAIEGQPEPQSATSRPAAMPEPAAAAAPTPDPVPAAATTASAATETAPAEDIDGKAVYDSACFACHAAGIAGAPKFGDPAVWSDRIARGIDALYANAINGYQGEMGVMPAKGGRADLSDAQVRASVDYMVEAAQ